MPYRAASPGGTIVNVRYDAAIIGAGADGLAAATILARAGLSVALVERAAEPGGRCVTRQFHPGFFASPFCDSVPALPPAIAGLLGLAAPSAPGDLGFRAAAIARRRNALLARVLATAARRRTEGWRRRFFPAPWQEARADWPGTDWADRAACDVAGADAPVRDPALKGSALELLAGQAMAPTRGGLGTFGRLLAQQALAAGVELHLNQEASEISLAQGRVTALLLADGRRLETEAVISTLDFKRSILSLLRWDALAPSLLAEAGAWRMAPPTARLLLALDHAPALARPRRIAADADARAAFRRGAIPARPAMLLNPVSRRDPGLAPRRAGVLTVTLSDIPFLLFDGGWTGDKRRLLAAHALAQVEAALPGTLAALKGVAIIAPPDMEDRLGATAGDLTGGALTPDQMLGWRPGPRLPIPGAYIAGPGSAAGPLGVCASGAAAAVALLADRAR